MAMLDQEPKRGLRPSTTARQCPCGRWIRWGSSNSNVTRALDCYECEEGRKDDGKRGNVKARRADK